MDVGKPSRPFSTGKMIETTLDCIQQGLNSKKRRMIQIEKLNHSVQRHTTCLYDPLVLRSQLFQDPSIA